MFEYTKEHNNNNNNNNDNNKFNKAFDDVKIEMTCSFCDIISKCSTNMYRHLLIFKFL